MGRSRLAAALLDPLFSGTYAVPKLALFPIFIFVFGLGSLSNRAMIAFCPPVIAPVDVDAGVLQLALGAAYTPLTIGPDGKIYTQNDGHLFVVGN